MSNIPPQGAYGYHDDMSHQMIETANEGQEQPDNSFSSSLNMAISIKPRARRPSIFHIGGDSPPHLSNPHSQQAGLSLTIPPPTGTTNIFPPISLDSFQQEIQPLNPGQDSSLFYKDHPLVPSPISRARAEQDLSLIIGNQMGGPHSQANRSQAMGMANQGHSFAPNEQITPSFGNDFGATQPYHLPVSNLPSDFRLDSSSRLQLPQPTLQGGDGGFSFKTAWPNSSSQNQMMAMNQPLIHPTGSQEIQFEGVLNQVPGQSAFYQVAGAGGSSQNQALNMPISPAHGIGLPSLPLHVEGLSEHNQNKRRMNESFLNPGQFGAGDIPARSPKRQTTWQVNNYFPTTEQLSQPAMPSPNPSPNPNLQLAGNWLSQGQASHHGHNNSSIGQNLRPRPIKNSVYDPLYEQMGLPIDPHLRMFLASRESGNGDGF